MDILQTNLEGLCVLTPKRFGDQRGHFAELYEVGVFSKLGISEVFVQDGQSVSVEQNTLRGLHFQAPPHAQAKLVRCGRGRLLDVAVDARRNSSTYGQWYSVELSAENGKQLFIPTGFLHGFVTLEPNTEVLYKCSDIYAPQTSGVVAFDDPDIGIEWPKMSAEPTLSAADQKGIAFADFETPFA